MPSTARRPSPPPPAPVLRSPAPELGPKARRTRESILETARTLFLERGFGGTSIDDITAQAGISRASFWTYFPSKLDVLRALGTEVEAAGFALADQFKALPRGASVDEIAEWVRAYLDFLDAHGAFLYAAFQAAYDDPETRTWGLSVEMLGAKEIGRGVQRIRGGTRPKGVDPTAEGLAILSMLERFWYHWRVAGAPLTEKSVVRTLAGLIWGTTQAS